MTWVMILQLLIVLGALWVGSRYGSMARVAREQNMSKEEARLTIEKVDKMRENYVQEFTGTSCYDTRNYDLVINMDEISEDSAVSLILAYIHSMEQ